MPGDDTKELEAAIAELSQDNAAKDSTISSLVKGLNGLLSLVKARPDVAAQGEQGGGGAAPGEEPEQAGGEEGEEEEPEEGEGADHEEPDGDEAPGYEDMLQKAQENGDEFIDAGVVLASLTSALKASRKETRELRKAVAANSQMIADLGAALAGVLTPMAKAIGTTNSAIASIPASPYREPARAGVRAGVSARRAGETQPDTDLAGVSEDVFRGRLFKAVQSGTIDNAELQYLQKHRTLPDGHADRDAKLAALKNG